jgi:hypothetical protein
MKEQLARKDDSTFVLVYFRRIHILMEFLT